MKFACSPKGEKTVLWTVLREAREKQVRSPAPNNLLPNLLPKKLAENNYFKKNYPAKWVKTPLQSLSSGQKT